MITKLGWIKCGRHHIIGALGSIPSDILTYLSTISLPRSIVAMHNAEVSSSEYSAVVEKILVAYITLI